MTPTRMTDTRDMTLEDADQALRMIFTARVGIIRRETAAEKQIEEIRQQLALDTEVNRTILDANVARLNAFILSHPAEFRKPRMRKTPHGAYGLRSSTRTEITDRDGLAQWAKDNGHTDLYRTVDMIVTKAVTERLRKGQPIPFAERKTGETAEYTLDPAVIEAEL